MGVKEKCIGLWRRAGKARLDEVYWANILDFTIRGSEWFTQQSLSPGRWALGFPGLYILYRTLQEVRPRTILEFGLGESTKMTFQYHRHFKGTGLTVIEQDAEWAGFFGKNVFDVNKVVKIVPLEVKGEGDREHFSYKGLMSVISGKKYDLIVIDGPWGSKHNSRGQIINIIEADLLAKKFVILLDDTNRKGERETLAAIRETLDKKGVKWAEGVYRGEAYTSVICSAGYKFLTSL